MPIYTKTGDKGTTALFGGKRVWKYDLQVEAYGMVDEATACIGLAHNSIKDISIKQFLTDIQSDLYQIMAYLSGAKVEVRTVAKRIIVMEKAIDELEKELPKLVRFVIPQGSEETVRLHMARAVVRTAERRVIEFVESKKVKIQEDLVIIQYLNRLSDCLFMLSRKFNIQEKIT